MGYNGRGFFPLWDTTEEFFSAVGYNGEGFPPLWDTTEEDFFHSGIQRRTISGWQINFFYYIPQRRRFFFHCILHHNRILCSVLYRRKIFRIVSHNAAGFLPLYLTMEDIFLCCGIQWKRFFCSLWDRTEEAFLHCGIQRKRFFHCGIQRKRFFPLWDTMEKKYTTQNEIFKF